MNGLSIVHLFSSYRLRLIRFLFHFLQWIPFFGKNHLRSKNFVEWLIDLSFYVADVILIPDILEILLVWIQPQVRLLNENEKDQVRKYFKNKVRTQNIRMSSQIPDRIANLALAFVTFNTIHFAKRISRPVFIHEMVHVWQYQKFGSVYIYRALKAQRSKEGYDYGGLEALYMKMLSNYMFIDFNFEQQGEIFEDYCRMKESEQPRNHLAAASFEYFIGQVRDSDLT